jgi:hypothetical protein
MIRLLMIAAAALLLAPATVKAGCGAAAHMAQATAADYSAAAKKTTKKMVKKMAKKKPKVEYMRAAPM